MGFTVFRGVPDPCGRGQQQESRLLSNLSWVLGFRQQGRSNAVAVAPNGHQRALQGRKRQAKCRKDSCQGLLRKENSIVGPLFGSLGPFQASLRPEPMTRPLRGAGKPLDRQNLHEARTLLSLCVLDTAFQLGTRRLGLCKGICITGEVSHLGVMTNHGF